jgi:RNA polymerase sigma-70 factor (ECF subfamily)
MQDAQDVTRLLQRIRAGDAEAGDELLPKVYSMLRAIAAGAIYRYDGKATLQPTALVNEAYLKLFGSSKITFADREHFLSVAANAMRNLLVDHARARAAQKRGGGKSPEAVDELLISFEERSTDVLELNDALERLSAFAPKAAKAVELRFFGGLTNEEAAHVLECSSRTVEREWRTARAWLYQELVGKSGASGA